MLFESKRTCEIIFSANPSSTVYDCPTAILSQGDPIHSEFIRFIPLSQNEDVNFHRGPAPLIW